MTKKLHCSPKNKGNTITCFSTHSLVKIAKAYNKTHPDKIHIPKKRNRKTKHVLWRDIRSKFRKYTPCDDDFCILKNTKVQNKALIEELESDFRPEMPQKWSDSPNEWLSTVDIQNVMEQYVEDNNDFVFIGPVPIDFDHRFSFGKCVSDELCKINLDKLHNNGIKRIGVIFNLDPHYKGGSHWVCLFVDIHKGGIYFIDSTGDSPPKEVETLMSRLQEQGNRLLLNKRILPTSLEEIHTIDLSVSPLDRRTVEIKNLPKNLVINKGTPCIFTHTNITNQCKFNTIKSIDGNKITLSDELEDDFKKCLIHSFKSFYNTSRFQYQNTECGIYAMFFLEEFIKGKQYDQIVAKIIHDAEIHKERWRYYRPFIKS